MKKDFWIGFVVGCGCLICLLVGLIVLPEINKRPRSAPRQTCQMNIAAIEGAKQMWMLENKKGDKDVAQEADLKPFLKNGVFPTCPEGGAYSINADNRRATCSLHSPPTGLP